MANSSPLCLAGLVSSASASARASSASATTLSRIGAGGRGGGLYGGSRGGPKPPGKFCEKKRRDKITRVFS